MRDMIRIGAGSAFCNDSALAVPQMLRSNPPDYLVFEHLAEGIMAPLAEAQARDSALGWSLPIRDSHVGPFIAEILGAGIKVVTNAGGLNPRGAAEALARAAEALGLSPRIAVVEGDDLRDRAADFARSGVCDMYDGRPFPPIVTSTNVYLGAFPIAQALAMGADIVVTGRVVDSALTLGPLIHEFGWRPEDHDLLAAGTAAGHLLECGTQATGGTFTDWLDIGDWDDIGYPIAVCRPDGSFDLTKPAGTGGLVSVGTVSEQLLYEVGDPAAYLVPDVTCDFSDARLTQTDEETVRVTGVRGLPPTPTYKVCATHTDGWRATALLPVIGSDAGVKARRMADGLLRRARQLLAIHKLPDFSAVESNVVGTGDIFVVDNRNLPAPREVVARIAVLHPQRQGAEVFAAESRAVMTTCAPGTMSAGPTAVAPVQRLFSFLLDKAEVDVCVTIAGRTEPCPVLSGLPLAERRPSPISTDVVLDSCDTHVPLIDLAWARSGDKGNLFNVAVIARKPAFLPYIRAALTGAAAAQWMHAMFDDPARAVVRRYDAPGLHAINLVFEDALRGGQTAGLKLDCNAKGMAQQLLAIPIPVPSELLAR